MLRMPSLEQPRDTKTRYQGVFARHRKGCPANIGEKCHCKPSYWGSAYDRARSRTVRTRRLPTLDAARNARADLVQRVERGEVVATGGIRLKEARERFKDAALEGRALNKRGKRYKPNAVGAIDEALRLHVEPKLGAKRLTDIRRAQIQAIVDEKQTTLSGSRIRGIVNSVRALYRWAQYRELVGEGHDPARLVHLPAMDATPVDRVASPSEFKALLAVLKPSDALAYGLAAYGFARAEQIRRARWRDVDLNLGLIEWGVEWEAAKYEASRRVVPVVPPLLSLLKRVYFEQGRPDGDQLVLPPRYKRTSGLISTGGIAKRAKKRWTAAKLQPINLQESRHTAATWLDAAGVSPKVASVLMGHAVPERQAGAAAITLARYTHALPEDIERARDRLTEYLLKSERKESTG